MTTVPRRPELRRPLPFWAAPIVAALGGVLLATAFPPLDWWPMAIIGTALILFSLLGRGVMASLAVALTGGAAFYGIHIFWLTTYLGAVPWLALGGLQTIFFAVGGTLIALAWRFGLRAWHGTTARLLLLPAIVAGIWTLREGITSIWPYGGFSWGRLAFSQSQSPLGDLAAWLGASGLSFIIALLAALLMQAIRETSLTWWRRMLVPAIALGVAIAMPAWPVSTSGSIRVAAVQGDSDAGLFAQRERGTILDDHLQATVPVIDAYATDSADTDSIDTDSDVDLIVWPENAADLNPLDNQRAAGVLDYVTAELDAPLVVGTITTDAQERVFNSLLLWEPPGGRLGDEVGEPGGAIQQYDKIHPVPFAEYLPDREFWYPFAPDLFDLVPRDYSIGERPNVFAIPLRDGTTVRAGLAICFDIVDDSLLRQMSADGSQLILAPTNNADFGTSAESIQQLAIARLRAIEYGRTVVNISTVGTSAIIAPDGSTIDQLETFTPAAMVESVPLSDTTTPAAVIGLWLEWLLALGGVVGLVTAAVLVRRGQGDSQQGRSRQGDSRQDGTA